MATNDDISSHRVRSNRRPEQPHPHEALVQAVEAVYRDVVEDEA